MADVKWIKFVVGTFDGESFKKIKRAKIKDGSSYRDKLTAVWFELLDLAGKRNNDGILVNVDDLELGFSSEAQFEDIATMIDRPTEEVECCINWFIANHMVEIIDDLYQLKNWSKYQSIQSLDDVREQTRKRVSEYRERKKLECNVTGNATVTLSNAPRNKNKNKNKEEEIEYKLSNDNILSQILRYWNEKSKQYRTDKFKMPSHKAITPGMEKAMNKALSLYGFNNITIAIERYAKVGNDDSYFFNYVWSLEDFLKQGNALPDFIDVGENKGIKWVNYINSKSGVKKQEQEILSNISDEEFWKKWHGDKK